MGIMENKMETRGYIGLYWGYMGIMEKKMETVWFALRTLSHCCAAMGRLGWEFIFSSCILLGFKGFRV